MTASGSVAGRPLESDTAVIEGRILDDEERPVADVRVDFLPLPLTSETEPIVSTVSDRSGRYSIEIPIPAMGHLRIEVGEHSSLWAKPAPVTQGLRMPSVVLAVDRDLSDGRYEIREEGEESELRWTSKPPTFAEPIPPARLRAASSGRVLDSDREPVAGALVWPTGEPQAAELTDRDGRFPWPLPRQTRPAPSYRAVAPSSLTATELGILPISRKDDDEPRGPTFVLPPATASVEGRVVGVDDEGVADAELRIDYGNDVWRTYSDPQGFFRVSRLPSGARLSLTAAHPAFGPAQIHLDPLREHGERRVTLVLGSGLRIEGFLVDESEDPLPGVEVRLSSRGIHRSTHTDSDGMFSWGRLPEGRFRLTVEEPGFVPLEKTVEPADGEPVTSLGFVPLTAAARLVGRVMDRDGNALEGVEVRAVKNLGGEIRDARGRLGGHEARTDRDGGFRFERFASGDAVRLGFYSPKHVPLELEIPSVNEEPLAVELEPGAVVAGTVTNERSEPLAGAWVRVAGSDAATRTDADGRFALDPMPATEERVVLHAVAFGYLPEEQAIHPFERDELEIALVLRSGASIRGRVLDADGRAVSGATARWHEPDADPVRSVALTAPTDGDGRFALRGIDPMQGYLSVSSSKHGRVEWRPKSDSRAWVEEEVILHFEDRPEKTVRGCVTGAGSSWPRDAWIQLIRQTTHSIHSARLSENGCFLFESLTPEVYRWSFRPARGENGRWIFEQKGSLLDLKNLTEDDVEAPELTFHRSAGIRGRLSGLSPEALSRARLEALSGDQKRLAALDPTSGNFRFGSLPKGDWILVLKLEGSGQDSREVSVAAGEVVEIDWVVERSASGG